MLETSCSQSLKRSNAAMVHYSREHFMINVSMTQFVVCTEKKLAKKLIVTPL